jgi:hypothetical protein
MVGTEIDGDHREKAHAGLAGSLAQNKVEDRGMFSEAKK